MMQKAFAITSDAPPLLTPARAWDGTMRPFAPWKAGEHIEDRRRDQTTLEIVSAMVSEISLVLTFDARSTGAPGTRRVVAFQQVSADVRIDLARQATLYWIASAQRYDSLSPNQTGRAYTDDSDQLTFDLAPRLTLTHDAAGWKVSQYDPLEYAVFAGFGLRIEEWVYWGFSVPLCPERQPACLEADSYVLIRSDGAEQLGDPAPANPGEWRMPPGDSYRLAFDACGNGALSRRGE